MSIIKVNCVDQTLVFENTPVIASGGLEENFVQFSFCSQWDGFTKTAVFWRSESEVFHNLLDAEDKCQVAPEVTASDGVIYFGVFGVDSAGRQRTSEVLTYRVVKGAITEGTVPSDPTPDIYTQLIGKYQEMVEIAEDTRKKEQAFEQAMTAAQQAFEQAMGQRQTQHEDDVDADQQAFETAMNAAHEAYKQEIRAMIEAGLLPDDSITTEKLKDGVVTAEKIAPGVLVDAFTKTETLTAATAALFGLGADAVPDDAFAKLSGLYLHNWRRRTYSHTPERYEVGEAVEQFIPIGASAVATLYFDIGTSVSVNAAGNLVLGGVNRPQVNVSTVGTMNERKEFVGKYFKDEFFGNVYYCSNSAVVTGVNQTRVINGTTWYGFTITECSLITGYAAITELGEWEYLVSTDRNAHPDSDVVGGYEYQYCGVPFNNAASVPTKIATGSYTGTGTYGSTNQNSLKIGFVPKMVFVTCATYSTSRTLWAHFYAPLRNGFVVMTDGNGNPNISGRATSYCTWGETFTFYHTGGTNMQMNESGVVYHYIAIG